jgi:hypothetical protein
MPAVAYITPSTTSGVVDDRTNGFGPKFRALQRQAISRVPAFSASI